jgi:hypothetical protein
MSAMQYMSLRILPPLKRPAITSSTNRIITRKIFRRVSLLKASKSESLLNVEHAKSKAAESESEHNKSAAYRHQDTRWQFVAEKQLLSGA